MVICLLLFASSSKFITINIFFFDHWSSIHLFQSNQRFQAIEFMNRTRSSCVSSFKYLSIILVHKWNWKLHISSRSRKLGHRLSMFNRILHKLDKRTRLAYFRGLALSHLDYADTIWRGQPALTSEMQQLSVCQERSQVVNCGQPRPWYGVEMVYTSWKALWTSMSYVYSSESNWGF